MKDINKIEITINSINKNIEISIDTNNMTINNSPIDKSKLEELLSIICLWKYEYGNSNIIDAEEFTVKVYTNSKIDKFHGKGTYPKNYEAFLNLVGELYE